MTRALHDVVPLLKLALVGDPDEGELRLRLQIDDGDVAWIAESKSLLMFFEEGARRLQASEARFQRKLATARSRKDSV